MGVFLEEVVDLLLEEVALLVIGGNPVLVFVELSDHLGVLVGRQSQVFLSIPHLPIHASILSDQSRNLLLEGSNGLIHRVNLRQLLIQVAEVDILLLQHTIESLDLLRKDHDLVLVLARLLAAELLQVTLQLFVLVTDELEFVLELAHLAGRQTQGLLGAAGLLVETGVFSQQLLNALLVGLGLLGGSAESVLVVVDLRTHL
jgi:hypothetical protein